MVKDDVLKKSDMRVDTPLRQNRPSILVLEDDMLLALDMEDHLVHRGHRISGPYSRVGQALAAIPRLNLIGAIVDLNLNGELSFPVIECLRQRAIPVIVCSGYAELPELRARLGDVPLMPKPWTPDVLDALIAQTFLPQTTYLRVR
jgi:ActR/RegA family two-component response regulator